MAYEMGWEKYVVLTPEDTWPVLDDTNADLYLPYSEYSVRVTSQSVQAELFSGWRQRRANRIVRANLGGNIAAPLYCTHTGAKSYAQWLIDWALSGPASKYGDSFTGRLNDETGDNVRHLGLRVNTMTISGNAQDGRLLFTMAVNGHSEVDESAMPALSATAPLPSEFLFADCQFFLSDEVAAESASSPGEEIHPDSFTITINNTHEVKHLNDHWPSVIAQGVRKVDVKLGWLKENSTYSDLLRSSDVTNRAFRIDALGNHLGTGASGTHTRMQLLFDRLNFANQASRIGLNTLTMEDVDWVSLKPDTAASEMEAAFSLVTP
jgi:hypothetical protein